MSATNSGIEWTDKVWNPTVGCSKVSAGCKNCYAQVMARRLGTMEKTAEEYAGLVTRHGDWTGEVRTLPGRLEQPLHWRKPCRVFVNSMSDLFHPSVPFEFVDQVFAVMALCPQHTFQILTKRPERMAEYMTGLVAANQSHGPDGPEIQERCTWNERTNTAGNFPLPNVWLGTSCEDQQAAAERIPHLLRCPAEVRFLSCEPLLGPIDFMLYGVMGDRVGVTHNINALRGYDFGGGREGHRLHWVIVGGESGHGARPCDVSWIRSIVTQCHAAQTACFVKQLGARPWATDVRLTLRDAKGGNMSEWPADLRVREFPTMNGEAKR